MAQFHFDPATYLESMRAELGRYDELQQAVAEASAAIEAERILDLGTGTGETARLLLDLHPRAKLVGIDVSAAMLDEARRALPADRTDLHVGRLEDTLPQGPFDLVVSALAVHHLEAHGKRDLFRRVAHALRPGGRFVLGDVVVPERPDDAVAPLTAGFDLPDSVGNQLAWFEEAGLTAELFWAWRDLAVLRATSPVKH